MNVLNWIFYAGHSKNTFSKYKKQLAKENRSRLIILSIIFAVACLVMTISSSIVQSIEEMKFIYLSFFFVAIVIFLLAVFVTNKNDVLAEICIYIFIASVLAFGGFIGITSKTEISATYIALLLVTPQFFFTKTYRTQIVTFLVNALYIVAVIYFKDKITWRSDIINSVVFYLVSMLIVAFTTNSKLKNYLMEEKVNDLATRDQLTGLLNRNSYEIALETNSNNKRNSVYCVFLDVNGLHELNNTEGHEAGDKMLSYIAREMQSSFGIDTTYRIGGDEYVSIGINLQEDEIERKIEDLKDKIDDAGYHAAIGYHLEQVADVNIQSIVKEAETKMYEDKVQYYAKTGVDRRGQREAHKVLCALYTKILKINITTDDFSVIDMDIEEQTKDRGYCTSISSWFENFGKNGFVHKDDLSNYLEKTNTKYMSEYFKSNKTSLTIFYKRKTKNVFKQVMMEIIPATDYSDDNQSLFLYVKNIDL